MIKESKYCCEVIKKHFNKALAMTKEGNEDFKDSTKCWICDNDYVDNDVIVRYASSIYLHNSVKREKSVKLSTANKQYVTVKIKGSTKLGLPWRLGRNSKSVITDFCCGDQ